MPNKTKAIILILRPKVVLAGWRVGFYLWKGFKASAASFSSLIILTNTKVTKMELKDSIRSRKDLCLIEKSKVEQPVILIMKQFWSTSHWQSSSFLVSPVLHTCSQNKSNKIKLFWNPRTGLVFPHEDNELIPLLFNWISFAHRYRENASCQPRAGRINQVSTCTDVCSPVTPLAHYSYLQIPRNASNHLSATSNTTWVCTM